jgi:hypothetical protein
MAIAAALLVAGIAPAAALPYVPATGWDRSGSERIHEQWFGRQLRAMHEPSFASSARLRGFHRRLRLLVLPTFQPGYAYRIDESEKEGATLRWVRLTGAGGYAPGRIAEESLRRLAPAEWRAVTEAMDRADLPAQPRIEHFRSRPNEKGEITVCADGTTYVVELLDRDGWTFLERGCDFHEARLIRLVEAIFRLHPGRADDLPVPD